VFVLGEEEVTATYGAGGKLEFKDLEALSQLSSEDYLAMRLYDKKDSANILWEWAFGIEGIQLSTSGDEGSDAVNSFIICEEGTDGSICQPQQAITAELVGAFIPGDTIVWMVEALKGNTADTDYDTGSALEKQQAYGKTQKWKVGRFGAASPIAGANGNLGEYSKVWQSQAVDANSSKFFSFEPDMSDVPHLPETYVASPTCPDKQYDENCVNGTNQTNVFQHNPHVKYKITALLNKGSESQPFEVKAEMDEKDILRQEYINHKKSSGSSIGVPSRAELVTIPSPANQWVEIEGKDSDYPYKVVLNGGMVNIGTKVRSTYDAHKSDKFTVSEGNTVTMPAGVQLVVSSGFRNPERQERVGSVINSDHMRGEAIDFKLTFSEDHDSDLDKEIAYYILWEIFTKYPLPHNIAHRFALEFGVNKHMRVYNNGTKTTGKYWVVGDKDTNGITDRYSDANHLHFQK
jgi:hypothetical protein